VRQKANYMEICRTYGALYNSAGNDSLLPNFRSYGAESLDKT